MPVIPAVVRQLYRKHRRKITREEIKVGLLKSARGKKLMRKAIKLGRRSSAQVANDIVAGFEQRFQRLGYQREFRRDKPRGHNYRYWPVGSAARSRAASKPQSKRARKRKQFARPRRADIPILITSASEVRAAYEPLLNQFRAGGSSKFSRVVSWPSGQREATVWWHERYKFWVSFSPNANRNYYLIAFGFQNPRYHKVLNIRCELNPPREGVNRRCGGVFVRGSNGHMWVGNPAARLTWI